MVEKPIGAEFMWRTRYQEQAPSDQRLGEPQPSLEMPLDPEAELIDLAPCDAAARSRVDLVDAITQRMSVRQYADRAMTLDELALLLWCTQGVKEIVPGLATMRTVPSAGARHALETYLVVHRVGDLSRGVYRYVATQHKLVRLREGPEVAEVCRHRCGDVRLGGGRIPDDVAIRAAGVSLSAPGRRARVPEPVPRRRGGGMRVLRYRGV